MRTITFYLFITLLSGNIVLSQNDTKQKNDNSNEQSSVDEKKHKNVITQLATIEIHSTSTVVNLSEVKEPQQVTNTNIILTEESKGKAIRTTIDFF